MKLIQHISYRYMGVSLFIMLLSIPAFYIFLQQLMWKNFDEELTFEKQWLLKSLKTTSPENFISFNQNIIIRPEKVLNTQEKYFTEMVYVPEDEESVPHRVIEFSTTKQGQNYQIRIQKSLLESEDIIQAIAGLQLGVVLVLSFSLLLINQQIKKKIWNPFYQTLHRLKNYQLDSGFPIQLLSHPVKELNDLNNSIIEMNAHSLAIFQSQKEFTENASHELQTPLAILQSNLDLLLQTHPLSEEQITMVLNTSENVSRLSRLNQSLLLLTKIDNHQFNHKKCINIGDLTQNIIDKNQVNLLEKKLQIQLKTMGECKVNADATAMEILLNNLFSNALRYSPENTNILIVINKNYFKISNTSNNHQTLDVDKLFRRFQKQKWNSPESIGIGLELCKKICLQNNMDIRYYFFKEQHHFELIF